MRLAVRHDRSVPCIGRSGRTTRLLCAHVLLALLAFAPSGLRAAGDGGPGGVGAAFGDGRAEPWTDPFPAQAFQERLDGPCPALLDHRIADLRGRTINLCAFSGKVLLLVNTASR